MDDEAAVSEEAAGVADLDARLDGELDITARQLIAEINERRQAKHSLPPGAFTVKQYQMLSNPPLGRTRAAQILEDEVAAGRLVKKRWRMPTGGYCYIYMRADENISN